MTTFLALLEKMKLAVDAGDLCMSPPSGDLGDGAAGSQTLLLADEEDLRLRRLVRPSLEDMAAVFIRMASCKRVEGALSVTGGALAVGGRDFRDRDLRMGFSGTLWEEGDAVGRGS